MTDESELDRAAHRSQWDFFLAPESLQERQNKVGEAQTLQHSREPQPGPGHWKTVNNSQHEPSQQHCSVSWYTDMYINLQFKQGSNITYWYETIPVDLTRL